MAAGLFECSLAEGADLRGHGEKDRNSYTSRLNFLANVTALSSNQGLHISIKSEVI